MRAPLARWLEREAARAGSEMGDRLRVLDVGCGVKPYYPFFAPHCAGYVGVDVVENPAVDLTGAVESLPVEDGRFDLVLCIQVLEHCDDPALAVGELRRVLRPGGRLLASTHGVQVYHPAPEDLWRWTHTGLRRLFADNADWGALRVEPGSGTAACVGMVLATYAHLLLKRAHAAPAARPLVAAINGSASFLDRRARILRDLIPGSLIANYHVVADAPPEP
ncbi:MAG: class I SAM-dependent methyltransferase [Gaiellaceae bacterium]